MSNMRNGFSTLNRWLGKRNNADKSASNGKLSKSSTNLSLSESTTNINETSQLEYNRITPLPAATSNAPFEQTFRITVLLPKDQLYVSRLGARVPLSKLLELVCENKLLDASKFEFRNPVDPSQVYSCDLTIGAVGLSEIRLCHKSESYGSFNTDEIVKLHRTPVIRDSLSSSEFSSRYSKHTTKTTSPYSSSNSLNSTDSTGMNCVRTSVSPPPALPTTPAPTKIAAPPRKKRAAPRPPSQSDIPEKAVLVNTNGNERNEQRNTYVLPSPSRSLSQEDPFISTPNLVLLTSSDGFDCNGNTTDQNDIHNDIDVNSDKSSSFEERSKLKEKNARNMHVGNVPDVVSPTVPQTSELPEPSPRKRLVHIKKKTAPAPPPRGSSYMDDTISTCSITPSSPDSLVTPNPVINDTTPIEGTSASNGQELETPEPIVREEKTVTSPLLSSTPVLEEQTLQVDEPIVTNIEPENVMPAPKPLPRVTTSTLLNATGAMNLTNLSVTETIADAQKLNVTKTMLNRTPTPEPRSLSSESPECDSGLGAHLTILKSSNTIDDDDNMSKQADSGIGEPIPSPIPDSLPSEGSAQECKSTFESSSDDDDMIKVYNFKLGKTLVKPTAEPKSLSDFAALCSTQTDSGGNTPGAVTQEATPTFSDTASWNFSIPISPPPNFADVRFMENLQNEKPPDIPITPKIKERPLLNFDSLNTENSGSVRRGEIEHSVIIDEEKVEGKRSRLNNMQLAAPTPTTPLPSPTMPLNDIVNELSAIINDNRMDTLIKKVENQSEIEAAKPNTLPNFSITTISEQTAKSTEIATSSDKLSANTHDSVTNHQNISIHLATRSDPLNSTVKNMLSAQNSTTPVEKEHNLNSRCSSQSSLTKLEQSNVDLNSRRSSSELSIGESPSLQSLEVIKTILNSRKNSLANSSDNECNTSKAVETVNSEQEPYEETKLVTTEMTPKKQSSPDRPELTYNTSKPKEIPKVYRYSGPPSIHFSTWNERPKVQVSIKNEGDYIFGGKNADSQSAAVTTAALEINRQTVARNNRTSMPASSFRTEAVYKPKVELAFESEPVTLASTPPTIPPKPTSPTKRMGIPEQDFQVPITVKPLSYVTAQTTVELRSNSAGDNKTVQQPQTKPTQTSGTTVLLNGDSQRTNGTTGTHADVLPKRTAAQVPANTFTLPRSGTNRFSMPAATVVGPSLLRSTSITQLEAIKPKHGITEPATAPFGQNTLRKTGLKEKILAKETEEQQTATPTPVGTTTAAVNFTSTSNTAQISKCYFTTTPTKLTSGVTPFTGHASTKLETKTLQSAKVELKLQKPTSIYVSQSSPTVTTSLPIPKTAPLAPQPPPAPTKVTSLKIANGSRATTPTSPDPRDQLLAAIRNFKRGELNRV